MYRIYYYFFSQNSANVQNSVKMAEFSVILTEFLKVVNLQQKTSPPVIKTSFLNRSRRFCFFQKNLIIFVHLVDLKEKKGRFYFLSFSTIFFGRMYRILDFFLRKILSMYRNDRILRNTIVRTQIYDDLWRGRVWREKVFSLSINVYCLCLLRSTVRLFKRVLK